MRQVLCARPTPHLRRRPQDERASNPDAEGDFPPTMAPRTRINRRNLRDSKICQKKLYRDLPSGGQPAIIRMEECWKSLIFDKSAGRSLRPPRPRPARNGPGGPTSLQPATRLHRFFIEIEANRRRRPKSYVTTPSDPITPTIYSHGTYIVPLLTVRDATSATQHA